MPYPMSDGSVYYCAYEQRFAAPKLTARGWLMFVRGNTVRLRDA